MLTMSSVLNISVIFLLLHLRACVIVCSPQSVYYFFYQRPAYPRDCEEVLNSCHYQRANGVYLIKPDGYLKPFEVYCDNTLDSGGWTIILRRHDGSVTFRRDWLDYKFGFGFLSQELWIGLEKLSYLTNQKMYELRIDITNLDGTSNYAHYTFFRISDKFSNYTLTGLGAYDSNGTIQCPTNMEYGTCLCQWLCGNTYCQPCPQEKICFCPSGFFLKGTDCVTQDNCGCIVEGNEIAEGEMYMFPNCVKSCRCVNNRLQCDNTYQCNQDEVCQVQNNIYQCVCDPTRFVPFGDVCVPICTRNKRFGTCGCERSCANLQECIPCDQNPRCYCPSGFYLEGQDCVHQSDCGCVVDGVSIQEGQSHMFEFCLKTCSCLNGSPSCNESYQCTANEICEFQSGIYQCSCKPGTVRVGDACLSFCRSNEEYGTCNCETSCGNLQGCIPCNQGNQCYCPTGYYRNGDDCVLQSECGCLVDEIRIQEGQSHMFQFCLKTCSCLNGSPSCNESYQCSTNEICELQSGIYQCSCEPGTVRVGDTCVSFCRRNEEYGTCNCETSCGNLQGCIPCDQGNQCYCPTGYYRNGDDCVPQSECGCLVDGVRIQDEESHMFSGCSRNCSCLNGQLSCQEGYQCTTNELCVQQDGVHQCVCNPAGYVRVGNTCVWICLANEEYGICSCEVSCENPQTCIPCIPVQQCYCPQDSYIRGLDCVPKEQCGCYDSIDDVILRNGESYLNSDCSEECTCINNQFECDSTYHCSSNAVCIIGSGLRQCVCNDGYSGDGQTCNPIAPVFTDCYDAFLAGNTADGVYSILPTGWTGSAFDVFCNMTIAGGGWTVFQRRVDGETDFYRDWASYKQGFGSKVETSDFWLGNDKLYYLTNQKEYILRIDIVTSEGTPYFGQYSYFRIGNESQKYQLHRGSWSGDVNPLNNLDGGQFSTRDQDNDGCVFHDFAKAHKGAWWYSTGWCQECYYSYSYCSRFDTRSGCSNRGSYGNLNGDYNGGNGENIFGYYYYYYCNLRFTEMKVRPSSV